MIDKGYRFVTIDTDLRYLGKGAKAAVEAFGEATGEGGGR